MVPLIASILVFVGTVLRMWDSLAEADPHGEYLPQTAREELHRYRLFLTPMGRLTDAATSDRRLYHLRMAQGWALLSAGAFLSCLVAISRL
jgi:hypothetical protein